MEKDIDKITETNNDKEQLGSIIGEKPRFMTWDKVLVSIVTISMIGLLGYDYHVFKQVHAGINKETIALEKDENNFNKEVVPITNNLRSREIIEREDYEKYIVQAEHQSVSHRLLVYATIMNTIKNRLTVGTYNQQSATDAISEKEINDIKEIYKKVIVNIQKIVPSLAFNPNDYPKQIKEPEKLVTALASLQVPVFRLPLSNMLVSHYEKSTEYYDNEAQNKYFEEFYFRAYPVAELLKQENLIELSQNIRNEYKKGVENGNINNDKLLGFNQGTWDMIYSEKLGKDMPSWFKYSSPQEVSKLIDKKIVDVQTITEKITELEIK